MEVPTTYEGKRIDLMTERDLRKEFPELYGEQKEVKVISLTDRNLTQGVLNHKRPDLIKQVLENTKSF